MIHTEKPTCEKYSYASKLLSCVSHCSAPQATVMKRTPLLTRAQPGWLSKNTTHVLHYACTHCTVCYSDYYWQEYVVYIDTVHIPVNRDSTGSDCGSGIQAPLQEFIKSPMPQPSLMSCSLACCAAEDRYDLNAPACSFET